jgi:glucosylceramidase
VPQGSIRIASQEVEGLSNVAFLTPSGKIAVIVLNETDRVITPTLQVGKRAAIQFLPAKSVATIIMKP